MNLLATLQRSIRNENCENNHLRLLFPNAPFEIKEKIVYRKNGKCVDKIIEFDAETGLKIKTTHYDYFNDKKIRSIDEFERNSGRKIRTINYVLYKSIDEYDLETGKKIRTINFNVKDESKVSSIQEYDLETGKISCISIYKRDGKTVSIIKRIDPITEKVTNWVNTVSFTYNPDEKMKYTTRCYDNIKTDRNTDDVANLIDKLYTNKLDFAVLQN